MASGCQTRSLDRKTGGGLRFLALTRWKKTENIIKNTKCDYRSGIVKWPTLEESVKKFVPNHRKAAIALSTKMIIIQAVKINELHIIKQRKRHNFEIGQIVNMDEVPLTFEVPLKKNCGGKGCQNSNDQNVRA